MHIFSSVGINTQTKKMSKLESSKQEKSALNFTCDNCGKCFKLQSNMRRHVKTHFTEMPLKWMNFKSRRKRK